MVRIYHARLVAPDPNGGGVYQITGQVDEMRVVRRETFNHEPSMQECTDAIGGKPKPRRAAAKDANEGDDS